MTRTPSISLWPTRTLCRQTSALLLLGLLWYSLAPLSLASLGNANTNPADPLSAYESKFFGSAPVPATPQERLQRMEKVLFGVVQTGDPAQRYQRLLSVLQGSPLPTTPSAMTPLSPSPSQPTAEGAGLPSQPPVATPPPLQVKPDEAALTQLEKTMYGKTFEKQEILKRLNRLEKTVFRQTFDNLPWQERVLRLNQQVAFNSPSTAGTLANPYTTPAATQPDQATLPSSEGFSPIPQPYTQPPQAPRTNPSSLPPYQGRTQRMMSLFDDDDDFDDDFFSSGTSQQRGGTGNGGRMLGAIGGTLLSLGALAGLAYLGSRGSNNTPIVQAPSQVWQPSPWGNTWGNPYAMGYNGWGTPWGNTTWNNGWGTPWGSTAWNTVPGAGWGQTASPWGWRNRVIPGVVGGGAWGGSMMPGLSPLSRF